jgi:hypothetical protein
LGVIPLRGANRFRNIPVSALPKYADGGFNLMMFGMMSPSEGGREKGETKRIPDYWSVVKFPYCNCINNDNELKTGFIFDRKIAGSQNTKPFRD